MPVEEKRCDRLRMENEILTHRQGYVPHSLEARLGPHHYILTRMRCTNNTAD